MPRLIDADFLKEEMDDCWCPDMSVSEIYYVIDRAPTVQYTPASESAWVKLTGMMPPEYCGRHECQHCGFIQNYHFREVLYPYCPRCGSKMKNGVSADDI